VIFAVVVMYDSFGVRRSTGEQAAVLNLLIENLDRNRFKLDVPPQRLREILGHQPREVSVGALVGLVLGALFNYDRLGKFGEFLTAVPGRVELWAYLWVFAALVIAGIVTRIVLTRRYKKSQVMKRFRARIFTASQTVGWIGLVTLVFIYERASYLSWRVWPAMVLLIGAIWAVWIFTGSAKVLPGGLAAEATQARKMKWFKLGRKAR
jgi:Divergent PAP2 family